MTRSRTILAALTLIAGGAVTACSQPATPTAEPTAAATTAAAVVPVEEKTLLVAPQLVDCTGVAATKCMQTKEDPSAEWTVFHGDIEGFSFEPGYDYVLRVSVAPAATPAADASSLVYTLLEVLSKAEAAAAGGADTLQGPVWLLDTFGDPASPTAVAEGSTITAHFGTDGKVTGNSGCNSYFGAYTATDAALSVGDLGGTMMACADDLMAQEQSYLAALQAAEAYTVTEGALTLTGASAMLTYHAQAGGLAGTSWSVTGYNNGQEAVVSVLADTELTITFDEASVSGNAGCNTYSGSYTLEGTAITLGPLATTRMMCGEPEGVMEQEMAFVAAMQSATEVIMEGSKLDLRTTEGALAVSAVAAAP